MEGNPLPDGVLKALKVVPPPPSPEHFSKADYAWIKLRVIAAAKAFKTPDAGTARPYTEGERNALIAMMASAAVAVITRALANHHRDLATKFTAMHCHVCGLWGAISADRTRVDKLQFRIESFERTLIAAGADRVRTEQQLQFRIEELEKALHAAGKK